MSSIEEIRTERFKKLNILIDAGHDPYPSKTNRTHTVQECVEDFELLSNTQAPVTVAGRVMVVRGQGAILFIDILDGTGKFQVVFKEDEMEASVYKLFLDAVDGGDFIEVTGELFITQKGQQSILAKQWRMLSKSLLPLPDKYHGLQDEDERFRKRYLDILTKPELKEMFERKAQFWNVTREFMKSKGFMEVETPTLEVTTGGAEANPFKTHHDDFDIDVFMRISVGELWQKRLMAAGFERVFEIGRAYRNEGSSPNHLQEFTNMEFYQAFADYEDGMDLVEELYKTIAQEVYGKTQFTRGEYTFDFSDKWQRIDYREEVLAQTGIDVNTATLEDVIAKLQELNVKYDGDTKERLMDTLWKYCRKNISGPAFLINHPKLVSPLAKEVAPGLDITQRFQPIFAGLEVGNGYSELNNPLDQKTRFDEQQQLIDRGDAEAMMPDYEFVEMLEHGMPPACGFGFGERLFAVLEDKPIRETTLFPLMKPKVQTERSTEVLDS